MVENHDGYMVGEGSTLSMEIVEKD